MRRAAQAWLAALLALAGACAPAPRPPEELVFWQFAPAAALAPAVRRFEAQNPGVHVRVERLARAGAADSVAAAIASGHVPDLCEVEGEHMPPLLASGALSDWSAGVADQRDSLLGWELCRVGDAIYGMPWRLSARMLFWNKDLFARAGLDTAKAPATWEQLVAAASRVQRLGTGVHGYGIVLGDSGASFPEFMSFAWANGGEVLSAGLDSSRFDSPAVVEALALQLRLRRAGLAASADSLDSEFASGRLGMRVQSSRMVARWERQARGLRLGLAAVPAPAARRDSVAPFGDGDVLVSFTRSKHKEHALRLARFLVRPENAFATIAGEGEGLPSNAGADTLEAIRGRPRAAFVARQIARARFAPGRPAWYEMQRAIEREVGAALSGDKPAKQAVADAGGRIAELLGRR